MTGRADRAACARGDGTGAPPVGVVIATLDRPGLLERAVTAVRDQDYPGDIHCVVVYDRVPVRPLAVPARPGRRVDVVANHRRPGLAGARNAGCAAVTGELVGFCDDDDRWDPSKLRRQVAALRAHPDSAAVACGLRLRGPGFDRVRAGRDLPVTRADLLADRVMEVNASTILVRREALAAAGEVDEEIPGGYGEDYDLLLRIAGQGPIAMVPEPLVTISWEGQSAFFHRWSMIVDGLRYLLRKHPGFAGAPAGRARIHGQIAFALAAAGRRREALAELAAVARLRPREVRLWATLPVLAGLVSGERVLRYAQRRGRGV